MKRLASIVVAIALMSIGREALATEVSGDQWGTWTPDQSPYELVGDVRVPPGRTLTIEPGVVVNALGHYRILVDASTLLAVGTPDQPILMTAEDQNTGWRGLRLIAAEEASVVSHCIIEHAKGVGDFPDVRGGAVYCKDCSPTISYNVLRYNSSHNANYNGTGAGVTTESSDAQVLGNLIHDNWADSGGGVMCAEYGTPRVAWNVIIDNSATYAGGGIYIGARSSAYIDNNVIMGNSSGGWGGGGINSWTSYIYYGTYCTVRNNLIANNTTSTDGGGIYCRYDRAVLTNNTFVKNHAAGTGGGVYVLNQAYSPPQVSNCIVWGNTAPLGAQVYLYPGTGSTVSINYSDVQGGWSGTGNIDDDPRFVDPEGPDGDPDAWEDNDYHLAGRSPCIDFGDPYGDYADQTDIDGDGQARVDMGCDEFVFTQLGDLNCDGVLDLGDVEPFALALADPDAYADAYPDCDVLRADMDGSGTPDGADVQLFIDALLGE